MLRSLELLCVHFPGFVAMTVTAGAVWLAVSLEGHASLAGADVDAVQRSLATHAAIEVKRDPGALPGVLATVLMSGCKKVPSC
jgi:hypothetical protein